MSISPHLLGHRVKIRGCPYNYVYYENNTWQQSDGGLGQIVNETTGELEDACYIYAFGGLLNPNLVDGEYYASIVSFDATPTGHPLIATPILAVALRGYIPNTGTDPLDGELTIIDTSTSPYYAIAEYDYANNLPAFSNPKSRIAKYRNDSVIIPVGFKLKCLATRASCLGVTQYYGPDAATYLANNRIEFLTSFYINIKVRLHHISGTYSGVSSSLNLAAYIDNVNTLAPVITAYTSAAKFAVGNNYYPLSSNINNYYTPPFKTPAGKFYSVTSAVIKNTVTGAGTYTYITGAVNADYFRIQTALTYASDGRLTNVVMTPLPGANVVIDSFTPYFMFK